MICISLPEVEAYKDKLNNMFGGFGYCDIGYVNHFTEKRKLEFKEIKTKLFFNEEEAGNALIKALESYVNIQKDPDRLYINFLIWRFTPEVIESDGGFIGYARLLLI